jgi:tight adherence protein C
VIWLVAGGYVLAVWLLALGIATRVDPKLRARLRAGPVGSRATIRALIGRRLRMDRTREEMRRRLVAGGSAASDADEVLGTKVVAAFAGMATGLSAWPSGEPTAVVSASVLAAAGFRLPDVLLARRAAALRSRASAVVPDLLDLVAVSVTAGLSPRLALERAPEALAGRLGEELARVRRDVTLGASWRAALRGAAERTGLPELRRLAITLERSERLGAPVAERLRALAREVRAERRLRREERARRAPVAMLFPLVFLILPAFVLAAVVPALLVATRGLP